MVDLILFFLDNYAHTGEYAIRIVKDTRYEHYKIPYIGKEFLISFELLINSITGEEWQNVIHITTGDNSAKMGDRIPGVWVTGQKDLHVSFAINGKANFFKNLGKVEENKAIKVEISQKATADEKVFNLNCFDVRIEIFPFS